MRDDLQLNAIRGGVIGPSEYRVLNMPRASVYRNSALSVATGGGGQVISWDALEYDTDGMSAVNATTGLYLTARTAGIYACNAWLLWAASASSYRYMQLFKNGATPYAQAVISGVTTVTAASAISAFIPLNAGDTVSVLAAQNTGGPVALAGTSFMNNGFQACLVSTL